MPKGAQVGTTRSWDVWNIKTSWSNVVWTLTNSALRWPILPCDRVATTGAWRGAVAASTSPWSGPRWTGRLLLLLLPLSYWWRPRHNFLGRPLRMDDKVLPPWRPDSREKRTIERVIVSCWHQSLSRDSRSAAVITVRWTMHAIAPCDVIFRRRRWWRHIWLGTTVWRQSNATLVSYTKSQCKM